MFLKWLPEYIIGHSAGMQIWWKDDEVEFSQVTPFRFAGRALLIGAGVRPT